MARLDARINPPSQLSVVSKAGSKNVQPALSHRSARSHEGWLRPRLEQLVISTGVNADEEVTVTACRNSHGVIDHKGESAEHPHYANGTRYKSDLFRLFAVEVPGDRTALAG